MGWRGNIRAISAGMRANEYAARYKRNEKIRQLKEEARRAYYQEAQRAVGAYDSYIEQITSLHKSSKDRIDWNKIKNEPKPIIPVYESFSEKNAEIFNAKYLNVETSFLGLDKFFEKIKLNRTTKAKRKDSENFSKKKIDYQRKLEKWELFQGFCKGIERKDDNVFLEIYNYYDPHSDVGMYFSGNIVDDMQSDYGHIICDITCNDVIPKFISTLTSTGKYSKKDLGIKKYNSLCNDYVSSFAIRMARDLFSILPYKIIHVTIRFEMVNPSTGFLEKQPILHCSIPYETLGKLNLNNIVPSEAMVNFIHKRNFSVLNGFSPLRPEQLPDLQFDF